MYGTRPDAVSLNSNHGRFLRCVEVGVRAGLHFPEECLMSTAFPSVLAGAASRLRRNWGWFLFLGILLILAGVGAISYPFMATLTTVSVFGWFLLFGAGVEIASGIWAGSWGGFFLHLLGGLLYLFLGVLFLDKPLEMAAAFTLIMAIFFVASGLVRAIFALTHHFEGRGWVVFSGLVTFVLGVMVWRRYPTDALWVIGLFVGVDLIFVGWSWVMLGIAARSLPASNP
jgi:uncharacterized membrane protein HdeD (DUF308 family)